jgi:hypothetical protein
MNMQTPAESDNRNFHRIFYRAHAILSCDEKTWPCEIIDLSLNGCLLEFEFPWSENAEKLYILNLHLSEAAHIKMCLSVVHAINNNIGFKCEYIDLDSISELRRLVELNLGDSQLLRRDLSALLHYK